MKRTKKLVLARETVRVLTDRDLDRVRGAGPTGGTEPSAYPCQSNSDFDPVSPVASGDCPIEEPTGAG